MIELMYLFSVCLSDLHSELISSGANLCLDKKLSIGYLITTSVSDGDKRLTK